MSDTPPPTIADMRRHGLKAFSVHCLTPGCGHVANMEFDALGLPDETVFVQIPQAQRFVCAQCGGRRIEVFPDWRDHVARGKGRPGY